MALVEIKSGDMMLEAEQLNDYWSLARQEGFDAVVTISNEIASSPGAHPTAGLKVRSNSRVAVHHISWPALLSAAVMVKVHRGVEDPEQAWIIGELIRYLEHPASGAMAFDDMGPNWTSVRDAARDDGLRKSDDAVREIAQRWDQLLRFAALRLGSRIGKDVQHVLTRAHQDPKVRSSHLVEAICSASPLEGTLRIPNTAGDLEISADLKARRLTAAMSVSAPSDRGGRGRCSWILSQLNDAPDGLMVEAYPKNARTPTVVSLPAAREDRDLLLGPDKREPVRFRLTLTTEMGMSRKTGARTPGFIDSVTGLIEGFYGAVVQSATPWAPTAPPDHGAGQPSGKRRPRRRRDGLDPAALALPPPGGLTLGPCDAPEAAPSLSARIAGIRTG